MRGFCMPDCRAYILRPDGHIQYRVDLSCRDEAHARDRAKALVDGLDVELWEGDRMIESCKGSDAPNRLASRLA
jgi:hypothetical protein